ncbi:GNAT family N-acetyltransferase [Pontibacter sp. BAB1700]|uniref:GNAT family N-acetyltransferase n=1 Tax=Pontibacter sp. BAB1700 TaxID=1144253 RepID=UPI00026BDD38|nr:GNAT family N-acetyltransferase [Pontibacter sp. BAB1700]EJF10817.1 GNAT family acetyltransferase [Pontibacter sp. BAB1700]
MTRYRSFETERLLLIPTSEDDAAFMLKLLNSPTWIRYIGDRNVHSVEEAAAYIRSKVTEQLERLGYANYTVIRKTDQEKLGVCGLYDREGLEGIDIGFAFLPEHEKKGYALEAALEIKRAGIEEFGITQMKAITVKDNVASQRLLEKLGLKFSKLVELPNDPEELLLYELKVDDEAAHAKHTYIHPESIT